MAAVNLVIIAGHLTADAELSFLPTGTAVLEGRIAHNRIIPGRNGSEGRERVSFVSYKIWGKRGEALAPHMTKGKRVEIRGALDYNEWEDATTKEFRSRNFITVEDIDFLGILPKKQPAPEAETKKPEPEMAEASLPTVKV